jgi:WD repeat-containing protein 89
MIWESSENNEDITALQHHPSNNHLLLSGGDDGLVSIFDTSIQDENDSLVQAFDHGALNQQASVRGRGSTRCFYRLRMLF